MGAPEYYTVELPRWVAKVIRARPWRRMRLPRIRLWSSSVYQAADDTRLLSDWVTSPLAADELIRTSLRRLRARSRDMAGNNSYGRKFKRILGTQVIGPYGIQLRPKIQNPNGNPDKSASDAIADAWENWCRPEACDYEGRVPFRDQQRLFLQTTAIDGEYLTRFRNVRATQENPYGFALQQLDVELLDVERSRDEPGGFVKMGVVHSPDGKITGYDLIDQKPSSDTALNPYSQTYRRFSKDQVLHRFLAEQASQTRGLPWATPALMDLKQLKAYSEAAVINARIGASKMGFYTSPDGERFTGDSEDSEGNIEEEVEPGTFREIPKGLEVSKWDPEYPRGEYPDFMKVGLQAAASGLGVSYPSLGNNYGDGVNYSSLRAATLEDQELWKALQFWTVDVFCRPVYERWLWSALLNQAIVVAGRPLPIEKYDKFRRVQWQGRRWPWVDPEKEANGKRIMIEAGADSVTNWIRESGRDPSDVFEEIASERPILADLGIFLGEGSKQPEGATDGD